VRLDVVVPAHDEAAHVGATVTALAVAVERAGLEAELVLVDDGSTDRTADAARAAAEGRLPIHVVAQPNGGRFLARRAGLEAATADLVLLLDARVRLDPEALVFVRDRVEAGERVWNGHVDPDVDGNPYGAFGNVVVALAWRDYFGDPRTTSYGLEDFDRYPKGTTCFLAPRELLLEATAAFTTRYDDLRDANDDTPVLRFVAARERIHLSPRFACAYTPRDTLSAFLRHSVHRGVVFLDGHGRRESRFFPLAVAFFPLSAALVLVSLRRPALAPAAAVAGAAVAAAAAGSARRPRFEVLSFGALAPVYALAHGYGMWRGLALMAKRRLAGGG
jgi:glycosyltransferase involved in cell wall biosynthesis